MKLFRQIYFPLFWKGLGGGVLLLCLPVTLLGQAVVLKSDTSITFASTQTWTFGEQTWSDRVVARPGACDSVDVLSVSEAKKEYRKHNGLYYYTWMCVVAARFELCPPIKGWRVPTYDDFKYLVRYATGSTLYDAWGVGGYAFGDALRNESLTGYYWSYTAADRNGSYGLAYHHGYTRVALHVQHSGRQVRCVKND
jgi:hypothetical protein